MKYAHAKVSASGRLSLPAGFRKAVGLDRGGNVVIELDGREMRIVTLDEAVTRAQALSRRLLKGKSKFSVDDFIAERHREAERE
ncbi:MAG: AbrB/MazE/SpoVT family DNA-binding domain-containing protein [Alphaproteobacteria bacterium]